MRISIKISLIGILSAVGISLRTVALPIYANVQLTPGMVAPILGGVLMGVAPGIAVGGIIGIYAGLVSGEFWLIPLIGNICLGLGPGLITDLTKSWEGENVKIVLYLILAAIVGGFLPTFGISIVFISPDLIIATIGGLIDLANALIAAIIAIIIWKSLISRFDELKT